MWDYAKQSQWAKKYGGPEKALEIVKKASFEKGFSAGRKSIVPIIALAAPVVYLAGIGTASLISKMKNFLNN